MEEQIWEGVGLNVQGGGGSAAERLKLIEIVNLAKIDSICQLEMQKFHRGCMSESYSHSYQQQNM